jgi:endonuclease/exonuclease/phosphatase family metal-dependent hydrolase
MTTHSSCSACGWVSNLLGSNTPCPCHAGEWSEHPRQTRHRVLLPRMGDRPPSGRGRVHRVSTLASCYCAADSRRRTPRRYGGLATRKPHWGTTYHPRSRSRSIPSARQMTNGLNKSRGERMYTKRIRASRSAAMDTLRRLARVALACLLAGLVSGWPVAGTIAAQAAASSSRGVPVMTQNMDEATDFGPVLSAATFDELVSAVTDTYLEVQASKIPERAAAVAGEIGAKRPTLVGLQEVSLWRTGPFGSPPATAVAFDQLRSLLDALNQQGLHYAVLKIRTGLDAEAPSALGFDVRVTDRDVLLARTDLPLSEFRVLNVQVQDFTTNVIVVSPLFGSLPNPRGWISVDAMIHGTPYRFVTTHLEGVSPSVQQAQGNELLQGPVNTTLPVVLGGDFNSAAAGGPDPSVTYGNLITAGFVDTWALVHPGDPGFTWPLHGEDFDTSSRTPTERIDLVLTRGGPRVLGAERVGNTTLDLTKPSGLWPSDHAGVVALLQMPDLP